MFTSEFISKAVFVFKKNIDVHIFNTFRYHQCLTKRAVNASNIARKKQKQNVEIRKFNVIQYFSMLELRIQSLFLLVRYLDKIQHKNVS